MEVSKKDIESIKDIFNYQPSDTDEDLTPGKISLILTYLESTDKKGGMINYTIDTRKGTSKKQSNIPRPLEENIVKCVDNLGMGYFYNLTFNNETYLTTVSVKFSKKERIESLLNDSELIKKNQGVVDAYLFGYPKDAARQYLCEKKLDSKYKKEIQKLTKEIPCSEIAYMVSMVQYIPVLEEKRLKESINKGKKRYQDLEEFCKSNNLPMIWESIEKTIEEDTEWIKNGCES